MKQTTVLSFGETSSSIGVLELDPALNKLENGEVKTTFNQGESIYISLHYDSTKFRVSSHVCSTGEIVYSGRSRSLRTIESQFSQEATLSTSYIIDGIHDIFWYGRPGVLTYNYNELRSSYSPFIVDVSFYIVADIYVYIPDSYVDLTSKDSFPVGVVINLEEI